mmetsp:Transcript_11349/g.17021  ORF Transcript_11349/g.17021 Transcript_11349/m.17021 type:complete len:370 (-) Transcript_11349:321-1430(-)
MPQMTEILHNLIAARKWTQALQRCKTHPHDVTYIHENGDHTTPLHIAILNSNSYANANCLSDNNPETAVLNFVQGLIRMNPNAATCKTKSIQNTPLHWACERNCSVAIFRILLAATPVTVLSWENAYGLTPLHYACSFDDSENFERIGLILQRLIHYRREIMLVLSQLQIITTALPVDCISNIMSYFPMATALPDCDGNTPLFIMLRKPNLTREILQLMVQSVPAQVMSMKNGEELDTPLHIALTNDSVLNDVEMVRIILGADPTAVLLVQNDYEWAPIHVAVMSHASMEVLTLLVRAEPVSLELRDYQGKTALMLLLERDDPSFQAVELFVSSSPNSLRIRDTCGNLPIDVALEEKVSDDIAEVLQPI